MHEAHRALAECDPPAAGRPDIDGLIRLHRDKLDLVELKRYFELFEQRALWVHYFGHE